VAELRAGVRRLRFLAGLGLLYLQLYLHRLLEYREDTIVAAVTAVMFQASSLLFLTAILGRLPALAGWSYHEVVFMYAFTTIVGALSVSFFAVPHSVRWSVRSGLMDCLLLRPVSPLLQLMGQTQDVQAVGSALFGGVLLISSVQHLRLHVTVLWMIWLLTTLACAVLIRFAVLMIVACLGFRVEAGPLLLTLSWLYDFMRYPLTAFNGAVQAVVTVVIPFSLASYFPAAFLLRPSSYAAVAWVVPAATVGLLLLLRRFWAIGLRHYESVGSYANDMD
jgi:ABC-2 type transport system permease protein